MAQPSITCYFNTRKRSAVDELKINRAKKVLLLENNDKSTTICTRTETIIKNQLVHDKEEVKTTIKTPKIVEFSTNNVNNKSIPKRKIVRATKTTQETIKNDDKDIRQKSLQEMLTNLEKTKKSTTHNLDKIREKLLNNPRLSELKSSIKRFNETTKRLKQAEEHTSNILQQQQESPKLKEFKSIEIEVPISPQKVGVSPEKPYLSPRKDTNIARKNLLNSLSPIKDNHLKSVGLKLPFKYRYLYELFENVDIVCQILFNRKETITFRKLKPNVEKMLKRNFTEKHLGQIKQIYPDAYQYTREKLRVLGGNCGKREEWELVIKPHINADKITEQIILERKRILYNSLLEKTKEYHNEFLKSLIPPLVLDKEKITRWHPEFDLEQVPEIESCNDIPQIPDGEKLTGQQILERAKTLFNCNTRMEQALAKLAQQKQQQQQLKIEEQPEIKQESILKGIPKALLEKVRQKQAAKALLSMTRSTDKQKEIELYQKLPEIARLARNLFVAEKKSVLLLEIVLEKLANSFAGNSFNCSNHQELEQYLRTISKEINGWINFVTVRNLVYVKLNKDADLSLVLVKLESLAKQKCGET